MSPTAAAALAESSSRAGWNGSTPARTSWWSSTTPTSRRRSPPVTEAISVGPDRADDRGGRGGRRSGLRKRPLMGAVAAATGRPADRHRRQPAIRVAGGDQGSILAGAACRRAARPAGVRLVKEIGDRHEAIRVAIGAARSGDAVIIAGKGHEQGQDSAAWSTRSPTAPKPGKLWPDWATPVDRPGDVVIAITVGEIAALVGAPAPAFGFDRWPQRRVRHQTDQARRPVRRPGRRPGGRPRLRAGGRRRRRCGAGLPATCRRCLPLIQRRRQRCGVAGAGRSGPASVDRLTTRRTDRDRGDRIGGQDLDQGPDRGCAAVRVPGADRWSPTSGVVQQRARPPVHRLRADDRDQFLVLELSARGRGPHRGPGRYAPPTDRGGAQCRHRASGRVRIGRGDRAAKGDSSRSCRPPTAGWPSSTPTTPGCWPWPSGRAPPW